MSTSAHGVLAFVLGLAGGLLVTLAVASGAPMALWCVHHPQCAFAIIVMHRTSQAQAPSFYPTPTGVYPSLCICLFLLHRVVGGPSGVPMYGKKNSYNVKVEIGEGENPDNAIRRFNRMFRNAGCARCFFLEVKLICNALAFPHHRNRCHSGTKTSTQLHSHF